MTRKFLFLLGGSSSIFDVVAEEFIAVAGGREATIALLLSGDQGWEDHLPEYTQPWIRRGVTRYHTIVPDETGTLDSSTVSTQLRQAAGIFIGGGHTPTYHQLYTAEPIRSIIRERYQIGVPIAGLSAGALITPEICAIPPEDTGDSSVRLVTGLGLVGELVVGVHFTEWNALPHMLAAMFKTQTTAGLGIDEPACVVLEDGQVKRVLGQSAYKIMVTDLEAKTYSVTICSSTPEGSQRATLH